eukprot:Sspe_Gene.57746::Locus_31683_Transcript_1_1_Confidence_1.000_Length_1632::g.57746::m.57746
MAHGCEPVDGDQSATPTAHSTEAYTTTKLYGIPFVGSEAIGIAGRCTEVVWYLGFFGTMLAHLSSPIWLTYAFDGDVALWSVGVTWSVVAVVLVVGLLRCSVYLSQLIATRDWVDTTYCSSDYTTQHIVCVPTYNEPVEVLLPGLTAIAAQRNASRIHVIVAAEEGAFPPEVCEQREVLMRGALQGVADVRFYTHPKGIPGHLKGCGSNVHHAMRCYGMDFTPLDIDNCLYTKLDAQVVPDIDFFPVLDEAFRRSKGKRVCLQAHCVHSLNRDLACAPALVSGLVTTVGLSAVVVPYNINPFGNYSIPLRHFVEGGLTNPSLVHEDHSTHVQCGTVLEMVPTRFFKSLPVGESWCQQIVEWRAQESRFIRGLVWLLPTLAKSNGVVVNIVLSLQVYFPRLFILVAQPLYYIVVFIGMAFCGIPSSVTANGTTIPIADILTYGGLGTVLVVALACPVLEALTMKGRAPQLSCKQQIIRLVATIPTLVASTFLALYDVLCAVYLGAAQQSYRPRTKVAQQPVNSPV